MLASRSALLIATVALAGGLALTAGAEGTAVPSLGEVTPPVHGPDRPLYYDRPITPADLDGRTLRELTLMRNWIFARAGNVFRKRWLDDFFQGQKWYQATGLDEKKISELDRANAAAIAPWETRMPRAELQKRRAALLERHEWAEREPTGALAFSPDGTWLVSGFGREEHGEGEGSGIRAGSGEKDALMIWEVSSGKRLRKIVPVPGRVTAVSFVSGKSAVAAHILYQGIFVWSTSSGKLLRKISSEPFVSGSAGVQFSGSESLAFALFPEEHSGIEVFDLATGALRSLLSTGYGIYPEFSPGPGKQRAVSQSFKTSLSLWNTGTGKSVKSVDLPRGKLLAAGGKRVVVLENDGTLLQFDENLAAQPSALKTVLRVRDEPLLLSPDGATLLAVEYVGGTNEIAVYDLASGKRSWTWSDSGQSVYEHAAAFSPDGKTVAIAGEESLSLLDVQTGKPVPGFKGHDAWLSDEYRVEVSLLSRALGVADVTNADDDRSPLDDPLLLDALFKVEQLKDLSRRDLRILRNMIYARHGRTFKSQTLQEYFERMEWYKPDPKFTDARLTALDKKNIKIVASVEAQSGGAMTETEAQQEFLGGE